MFITKTSFLAVAGVLALTNAAPLQRRIAQVISDSTQEWVKACTAAGGAEKCGTTSQTAFMTLLAAPGDCEQQNAADSMIDLAKTLNNDPKMIALAQVFAQQPRNSPDKLSVNYCQQEPKNAELKGLFQCQFQGVDPKTFTKNVKVGGSGTIPLGMNAPLDPPGSCKAHPQGGIADGSQLVALTQDPGVGNSGNAGSSNSSGTSNVGSSDDGSAAGDSGSSDDGSGSSNSTTGDSGSATDGSDSGDCSDNMDGSADGAASDSGASNGTTTSGSGAGTANASNGAAAPSDSSAGSANSTSGADASGTDSTSASDGADGAASGDFQLKNGQDAQAQNAKFETLTESSSCKEGDQACINNGFAQCVGGKFQTTQCAAGTQCFALPKLLAPGTSIACTTEADASSRIKNTGATGGITGA